MVNHPNRAKNNGKERAVVVTTQHRGVFFGYATDVDGAIINLRAARNCLSWPAENKGFMGLAAMGPVKGARVGPAADIALRDTATTLPEPAVVVTPEPTLWVTDAELIRRLGGH